MWNVQKFSSENSVPDQKHPLIRKILLVLFLCVFSGTMLQEARGEQTRIAFMNFNVNGKSLDKEMGVAASELVQNVVVHKSKIFVVERSQFNALAKEHELQYSALVDENTAIEIGKVAGANYVVLGSLNAMGNMVFITARLVGVEQGLVMEAFRIPSPKGINGLYYALEDLGNRIAGTLEKKGIATLNVSPTPTTPPAPTASPAPTTEPTPAESDPALSEEPEATATPAPQKTEPTATPRPQPPTPTRRPTPTPRPTLSPKEANDVFSQGMQAFSQGNKSKAAALWGEAAKAGHVEAKARLGECYYYGLGVPRNHSRAFPLLKEAARRGSLSAQALLHKIDPKKFAAYKKAYLTVYPSQKTPTPTQPTPAFSSTKSAKELYQMGQDYYHGREGKPKNYKKAFELFAKASDMGNPQARTSLGYMYEKGIETPQNYATASYWYQKAADQNYAPAQNRLGLLYESGKGVSQNDAKAFALFESAAKRRYKEGMYNLGRMYEKGVGVTRNVHKAVFWYHKAAARGYLPAKKALKRLGH